MYIKESRRTLLIRDQISSSGYWDHMNDKMKNPRYSYYPLQKQKNKHKKLKLKYKAFGFKQANVCTLWCYPNQWNELLLTLTLYSLTSFTYPL